MNRKELEKVIGKVNDAMEKSITDMGTPIEYVNDEEVAVEVFPNRPDLLSLQNFARAVNQYRGKGKLANFNVKVSGEKLIVDKSLPKEWPYAIACIIKGLKFNDERIKEIIDIQEKLGMGILRKRKKGGIGLYPLEKIEFPIKFVGKKPEDIKFKPLEFPRVINGRQILGQHPTGREYADICQDWEVFPVFIDKAGSIMSMPPIINSHNVGKIDETTKEIFLEATGTNLHALKKAFNIIVSSLVAMGGQIYSIDCKQQDGKVISIPDLSGEEMDFKVEDINKMLGVEFSEKKVKEYLARMGIGVESTGDDPKGPKCKAIVPAYRTDILHWVDLAEEVAIAHGYDNFEPIIPEISTIAEEDPKAKGKRVISNVLAGLGLLEVNSFHINTKKDVKKIHYGLTDFIELEDSKTGRDVLRVDLLTNMMQILYENSDASYPHKIFEIGRVFSKDSSQETGVIENEKLSVVLSDEKVNFTVLKQILDYLFKMLEVEYEIKDGSHVGYIDGRCGEVIVNGKSIGYIGEVNPRVLKNWKIKMPSVALEIELEGLI
jgi:phenylalanyl-tRNA synthetase beta chain